MIKKLDGYLLTNSINPKNLNDMYDRLYDMYDVDNVYDIDNMYDHMKPKEKNFQLNVHISHVSTNNLPPNMTTE